MKKFFTTLSVAAFSAFIAVTPVAAEETEAAAAAAVKHVELKDGTKVEIKDGAVFVIGKDGKATPATDGTWEAKDGAKIVTKGGKVVE